MNRIKFIQIDEDSREYIFIIEVLKLCKKVFLNILISFLAYFWSSKKIISIKCNALHGKYSREFKKIYSESKFASLDDYSKNIHFQCAFSLAKINFRKHLSRKFLHFNLIRSFFWIIQKLFDTSSILTRKNLLFILKRIHHLTLSIYRTPINTIDFARVVSRR